MSKPYHTLQRGSSDAKTCIGHLGFPRLISLDYGSLRGPGARTFFRFGLFWPTEFPPPGACFFFLADPQCRLHAFCPRTLAPSPPRPSAPFRVLPREELEVRVGNPIPKDPNSVTLAAYQFGVPSLADRVRPHGLSGAGDLWRVGV